MKCENHPRYQVKRKPRGRCLKCWTMWWLRRWITVEYRPKPKAVGGIIDALDTRSE